MEASFYVLLCCLVLVEDAYGSCGSLTIMKPTFVDRNITLKFVPRHRGISNIAWKYTNEWDVAREHIVECVEEHFQQHVEDGPYYHTMIFFANKHHNNSKFHVQCSDAKGNSSSNTVKLHLNEIRSACGNLVLLSPEIKYGTNVEIAYYPSDLTLANENPSYNERSWLKLKGFLREVVHHRNDIYEERKISDYLYTLTIYNFIENKAGPYALKCGYTLEDTTNRLDIHVTDKPLIGPILDDCVYGNADTIIYCNTSRTTGKPRVTFSIGSKVVTMLENEKHRGVYTVVLDSDTWRDNDDHIVTCKVSNDDYVHDLNSSAKLCYMEKGSDPFLIMPEYIYDENTTVGCEVSNVRPPAVIEILVDNQAIDAIQKDLLNETSKTYTSKASILKIDKNWNGKKICCRRKATIYGNMESTCKTLNIKYSPTELIMNVTLASSNVTKQSIDVTCFTMESNPPCGVNLSTNTTQLVKESSMFWTENTASGFKSYIKATFSAEMMIGRGIINCFTTCDKNLSNLKSNFTIYLPNGPDMVKELNVLEGSNVSFKCKYNLGDAPHESSVVWTRASNNLRWENCSLEITSVQRSDEDFYTCTFTSEMVVSEEIHLNGSNCGTLRLNVCYKSTVKDFAVIGSEYTNSVTKAENDTAVLVCVVDGNPNAEITIAKADEILEVENNGSNLTHTIASLSCLNAGLYSCTSANRYNRDRPSKGFLELLVSCSVRRPYDGNVKLIFYSPLNENVTLSYTAFAYPIPLTWQFVWEKCVGNENCTEVTANLSKYAISTIGLSTSLIITQVNEKDYGPYQLTIWNGIGRELTERFQLKKEIRHSTLTIGASVGGSIIAMVIGFVLLVYCIRRKVSLSNVCGTCGFRNKNSNSRAKAVDMYLTCVHHSRPVTDVSHYQSITDILEVETRTDDENVGAPQPLPYQSLQQVNVGYVLPYTLDVIYMHFVFNSPILLSTNMLWSGRLAI
ncbi:uncharacterized protein LOC128235223 isoform X2 [Mya arenaria]|uniref:uncharacterized protein LOC128235223 isoform X2 n=1 Tax=Mya arenaria TaxID=6604 RepID=UPI0022E91521|nr:uncharacterized protein LOC128235223 isoform X2 [Mya arenaria]